MCIHKGLYTDAVSRTAFIIIGIVLRGVLQKHIYIAMIRLMI